jgi:hypothetical protein
VFKRTPFTGGFKMETLTDTLAELDIFEGEEIELD